MSLVISFQGEGHETPGESMPPQTSKGQDLPEVGFMSGTQVPPMIIGPMYCDSELMPTRSEDSNDEKVTPHMLIKGTAETTTNIHN